MLGFMPQAPARARQLWAHTLSTPVVWTSRLASPEVHPPVWPEQDGFDFEVGLTKAYQALENILHTYGPYFDHKFDYRTTQGAPYSMVVSDMLQHILLHSHYHRGQVNLLLKEAGIQLPSTDFIVYSRTSH
jgi:uncharacterized damage-inducible protein DinB